MKTLPNKLGLSITGKTPTILPNMSNKYLQQNFEKKLKLKIEKTKWRNKKTPRNVFVIQKKNIKFDKSKKIKTASKQDINKMLSLCIKKLEDKDFFYPAEKKPIMLENLRSIFYKLNLSEKEIRILSSVFAGLVKKKGH